MPSIIQHNDNRNLTKILFLIFIAIITQPYLKPFGIGTESDVQPIPLLLSIFVVGASLFQKKRIDSLYFRSIVFIITMMVLHTLFFGFDGYYFIRGFYGYISIIFITMAVNIAYEHLGPKSLESCLKVIFSAWSIVGLIQVLDPQAFTFWRDKLILTTGRGSLSLATEPAYFSLALILTSLTLYILNKNNTKYILATLVLTLFVAKSSVGVIYTAAILGILLSKKPLHFFIVCALALSLIAIFLVVFQDSRMGGILIDFIRAPLLLAERDQSFGLRVINIVIPIKAFFDNFGLPYGLFQWTFVQYEYLIKYFSYFNWINYIDRPENLGSGRILSIHGQLLFELGVFSSAAYYFFWKSVKKQDINLRLFIIIMLMALNGLTLNNPFFSIFIAVAYSHKPTKFKMS
ncbi:hypothetical protein [Pseudomonas sp. HY13-MNA-CIBAN-0226]|uniref:hypothetical protein n=1 Tax=Pseudomonas sp. HY13-MNA-CIBAN-0226 TaxID=3140473 RepID=UPI00331EC112